MRRDVGSLDVEERAAVRNVRLGASATACE